MALESWIILALNQAFVLSLCGIGFLWWRAKGMATRLTRLDELEERESRALSAMQSAKEQLQSALASVEADDGAAVTLELQQAKTEITALNARLVEAEQAGESADGDDEDGELKTLLQQFTRDSRDMLECIAGLERDNKALEDELASLRGSVPEPAEASSPAAG